LYAYTTFIPRWPALEVTESIDYTTALVDETMTVNKKLRRTRSSRGNVIDADVTSHRLEFAKQEIPVRYYTY
jgi:hypothetical protein